jgi:hypothetical protein
VANELHEALRQATTFLKQQGWHYVLIGGIANQFWGQSRFTYDIDLKVLVSDMDYDRVRCLLIAAFPAPGRPELPENPLIVSVKINAVIVDFLLTTPGYEEQMMTHAVQRTIADLVVWVCSAEDLIIQKALANRAKDWQDIEGILIEQQAQLDSAYVEDWLVQFAEILECPDMLSNYRSLRQRVAAER